MYFWCFGFRGELGFLNCDDVCMCVVNKQFELLEFVSESVYVDLQYDEISLVPKISAYSWWNCQATHNRLQIEINYYPDSLMFVSAGFLARVSSQRLN